MILAIHGAAGGWDELAIALVAFGVMWVAVKLAGRKAQDDDDEDEAVPQGPPLAADPVHEERQDPVPPATPLV
jgi:cell division septation protein DedD